MTIGPSRSETKTSKASSGISLSNYRTDDLSYHPNLKIVSFTTVLQSCSIVKNNVVNFESTNHTHNSSSSQSPVNATHVCFHLLPLLSNQLCEADADDFGLVRAVSNRVISTGNDQFEICPA
jgi:hypothetical protein